MRYMTASKAKIFSVQRSQSWKTVYQSRGNINLRASQPLALISSMLRVAPSFGASSLGQQVLPDVAAQHVPIPTTASTNVSDDDNLLSIGRLVLKAIPDQAVIIANLLNGFMRSAMAPVWDTLDHSREPFCRRALSKWVFRTSIREPIEDYTFGEHGFLLSITKSGLCCRGDYADLAQLSDMPTTNPQANAFAHTEYGARTLSGETLMHYSGA